MMRADIAARLHANLLVIAKSHSDYYGLRWALTIKGYRNFEIIYSLDELAAMRGTPDPDCILISSAFDAEERTAMEAEIRARRNGAEDQIHTFDILGQDFGIPLSDYTPYALDTLKGRIDPDKIPVNIELELTSRCNARCVFCPIDDMARVNRTMSAEVLDAILARAKELPASLIYLCGVGEPTLYKGIVDVVRTIATEIGCPVGLNSNGQLLTGARFRELLDAGLSMVNVSINGVSDDVYGTHMKHLDRATVNRNVEEMLRIKPNAVSLQGVITQQNHREIPELVRYWTEKGVKVFTFNQCSNKSGFLKNYQALWYGDLPSLSARIAELGADSWVSFNSCNFAVKQEEFFLCRVPLNFISVDVEGNILHCMHDFASETSYGKFAAFGPPELRELLLRRVESQPRICDGCNSKILHPEYLLWNGQVMPEREIFEKGVSSWETALSGARRDSSSPTADGKRAALP
jgi:MoaA/NifB/PqqE/SkfB family radical SAM enzyme